ncbi:MAG: hypothetical protein HW387_1370 [Parachlamydiales bacterium]|nr:hypothetical protein [Parachlamydiales bacterium]
MVMEIRSFDSSQYLDLDPADHSADEAIVRAVAEFFNRGPERGEDGCSKGFSRQYCVYRFAAENSYASSGQALHCIGRQLEIKIDCMKKQDRPGDDFNQASDTAKCHAQLAARDLELRSSKQDRKIGKKIDETFGQFMRGGVQHHLIDPAIKSAPFTIQFAARTIFQIDPQSEKPLRDKFVHATTDVLVEGGVDFMGEVMFARVLGIHNIPVYMVIGAIHVVDITAKITENVLDRKIASLPSDRKSIPICLDGSSYCTTVEQLYSGPGKSVLHGMQWPAKVMHDAKHALAAEFVKQLDEMGITNQKFTEIQGQIQKGFDEMRLQYQDPKKHY